MVVADTREAQQRKEQVTDLTRFGFANARKAPANFKKGLADELNKLLK